MPTIVEALTLGIGRQRAGKLAEAEAVYREILRWEPRNPDALHLLGLVAHESGRREEALAWISKAAALRPSLAPFQNSLGMALQAAGRPDEARATLENALRLDPQLAEARVNLGNVLQELGLPRQAEAEYRRALEARPDSPEIHNNLGNACLAMGVPEQAAGWFFEALRLRADYPEAMANLAGALQRLRRFEEAEEYCRKALAIRPGMPEALANFAALLIHRRQWQDAEACCREALRARADFAEAWCNLGNIYLQLDRREEAESCCRRALRSKPQHPESWNNLGNALKHDDRLEEASECYRRALELRPDYADARANLGVASYNRGRFTEAMACYDRALALDPAHADARMNRALLLLLTGAFEDGWREYEWRWNRPGAPARPAKPLWKGEPLDGRTLLITCEQGLGDAIQCARYLPLLSARGARVMFESPPGLAPLVCGLVGNGEVVGRGSEPPDFDVHCALFSLPRYFGILPGDSPYLLVDRRRAQEWRDRLDSRRGMRVGLVWAGNPKHPRDRFRSVPAGSFRTLADVPGVRLFSLQQGAAEDWLMQLVEPHHQIADTAAMLMSLDLVITVDTMVAHLAGALGRPVWILLPWIPDWRWQLEREDTPWYRSARLFRQEAMGDWTAVLERVRNNLSLAAENFFQASAPRDDKAIDGPGSEGRPRQDAGTPKSRM